MGSVFGDKKTGEITHFECLKVNVVDSTGAGDAYVGALCHFVNKVPIKQAVQLAGEYSSLSVQFKGTQASYPFLKDLDSRFRL